MGDIRYVHIVNGPAYGTPDRPWRLTVKDTEGRLHETLHQSAEGLMDRLAEVLGVSRQIPLHMPPGDEPATIPLAR